ncbi:tyrosine-type recombinase/integrase [Mycoplasmatota bacterium WC30]
MKLEQAIRKYEKHIKVYLSDGTVRYFYGKKKYILEYLGDHECSEINSEVLEDFIINLKIKNPKISNVTLNKYLKMIRQILGHSCKIKLEIEKLPEIKKITIMVPITIRKAIYDYFELDLNNMYQLRNYIMFRLFFETGLRLSELGNLRINDFDMINKSIHVKRTKTNIERFVFYLEETNKLLHKYIVLLRITDYIFINFETKARLQVYSLGTIISRIRKKLNIQQSISPHKWRHTFANGFINRNGNIEVLRQIMGHTSLLTTQKYLHLNKENLQKEYIRVNNLR